MPPVKKYAVSADICGSKVVLFLGAGASAPLGLPLMDSFMDVLEGQMDPKSLSILRRMYQMPDRSRDLEIVFEAFQDYDTVEKYFRHDRNWVDVTTHPNARGVDAQIRKLMEKTQEIKRLAAKVVLQQYSNVKDAELRKLYQDFVLLLAESSTERHVPVFTTNYDLAIETLAAYSAADSFPGFDLVDGFTSDNVRRWDPSIFHGYRATAKDGPTILLFKLHGSCQWRVHTKTKEVTKESIPDLVSADSTYDNALMWPTQTKSIKKGPYETNYNYLEQCLMQAEACLVIGFSFRDEVIKRYFAKALDLNEKLRLALVDPRAEALAHNLLEVEPMKTIAGPEQTIVVRRSDGSCVHAIPCGFKPDRLWRIVKALLRIGFPLDGEVARALFT